MNRNQKLRVIYKGITINVRRNKVNDMFDYYTALAIDCAVKAIETDHREGNKTVGIVGDFGSERVPRSLQVSIA
jgi:hypothetical protein